MRSSLKIALGAGAALLAGMSTAAAQIPAGPGSITSAPPAGQVSFHAKARKATVHLRHAPPKAYYRLAKQGNLDLSAKLSFACPVGDHVASLSYAPLKGKEIFFYQHKGPRRRFVSLDVALRPWTAQEFERLGAAALRAAWTAPTKPYSAGTGAGEISASLRFRGRCAGDPNARITLAWVRLRLTAIDVDY